jgi:hypothetical protein
MGGNRSQQRNNQNQAWELCRWDLNDKTQSALNLCGKSLPARLLQFGCEMSPQIAHELLGSNGLLGAGASGRKLGHWGYNLWRGHQDSSLFTPQPPRGALIYHVLSTREPCHRPKSNRPTMSWDLWKCELNKPSFLLSWLSHVVKVTGNSHFGQKTRGPKGAFVAGTVCAE